MKMVKTIEEYSEEIILKERRDKNMLKEWIQNQQKNCTHYLVD